MTSNPSTLTTRNSTPASPALSELMEEFDEWFEFEESSDGKVRTLGRYFKDDLIDFIQRTFAAGVKAGLMEAR